MRKCATVACALAALLLVVLPAGGTATTKPASAFWELKHCSPTAADTTSFQIYFQWSNEDLLDHYVKTGSVASLPFDPRTVADPEDVLSLWRFALRPPSSSVDETRQWLTQSGVPESACRWEWDSVHCSNVAVSAVSLLFGRPLCAYEQRVDRVVATVPHLAGRKTGHTYWLAAATNRDLLLRPYFRYVAGIAMYDPTVVPYRTDVRSPRAPTRPAQVQERLAAAPYINHFLWPINTGSNAPVILNGLGLPPFAPLSSMGVVDVALNCPDGTPTYSKNLTQVPSPNLWCQGAHPTQVQVSIPGTSNSVTLNVSVAECATAFGNEPPINASLPWVSMVICQFNAHSLVASGLNTWQRYEVQAATVFSDGSVSEPAIMKNFWQAEYLDTMTVTIPNPLDPSDIRELYGISSTTVITSPLSAQGILEFSDTHDPQQGFLISDLRTFLVQYGVVNSSYVDEYLSLYLQEIGTDLLESRGETSLDVEMMMSLARGAKTYLWNIVSGPGTQYQHWAQAFIAWGQNVTSGTAPSSALPPSVWSVSYGGPEWNTTHDSEVEATTLNVYFKLLTAAGVTMVISSGDSGAGFYLPPDTVAPLVSYPASSPYVVAVGATAQRRRATDGSIVQAVCSAADGNVITSGGAFSQQFELPDYQREAVTGYAASFGAGHPSTQVNTAFRAVPDAAAIGAWVNVVFSNGTLPVFGTSISAPVFSAMLSLANDMRRAAGYSPLALANMLVYNASRAGGVFADVTEGSNCAGEQYDFPANFPTYPWTGCYNATPGWDPASGVGTPLFPAFAQYVASWPNVTSTEPTSTSHTGAIVGGVLGGLAAVAVAGFVVFRLRQSSSGGDYQQI